MQENKILEKHKVITKGNGDRRIVLDRESGLCYSFHNPAKVTAVFDKGRWLMARCPSYHQGGWGRGSTGDSDGYYMHDNTQNLLRSTKSKAVIVDLPELFSPDQYDEFHKSRQKIERVLKTAKKQGVDSKVSIDVKYTGKYTGMDQYSSAKIKEARGIDVFKIIKDYSTACQVFVTGKGKKTVVDDYVVTTSEVRQNSVLVAFKDKAKKVWLNSQLLRCTDFERSFMGNQSMIQKELKKIANFEIPFNVLEAARLALNETTIVEQGPESSHVVKDKVGSNNKVNRHFTGALFLENAGRKFLMDIDREEIKHDIFNVFFVEVSKDATSIKSAYESMIPDVVKQAMASGLEVKRQGEWFFIPTGKKIEVGSNDVSRWARGDKNQHLVQKNISHGKGRPNSLYAPMNFGAEIDALVCGIVEHSGREHNPLCLGIRQKTWTKSTSDLSGRVLANETKVNSFYQSYGGSSSNENKTFEVDLWQVVGNTTVDNFTITGDVD